MAFAWPWQRKRTAELQAVAHAAAQTAAVEVARAMISASPMVGAATAPLPTGQRPIYSMDQAWAYAIPQSPKYHPGQIVNVDTLRQLAETYDVLRSCIEHLKREVAAVPDSIVARDSKDDSQSTARDITDAEEWFSEEGGLGGTGRSRSQYVAELLEDLLVVGAGCAYLAPTRGGGVYEAVSIDAATIRPRVDVYGWPGPGEKAYEQWVYGVPVAGFTREELYYDGIYPISYSPYFRSAVEHLVSSINSALHADQWNSSWLTDGDTPDEKLALPQEWTPAQVMEWQAYWDGLLAGNKRERHKTRFVPAGTAQVGTPSRKEQDFQEFELWLAYRTCARLGVAPAAIGLTGQVYKHAQEGQQQQTTAFGAGVLLAWRKRHFDMLLARNGWGHLQSQNVTGEEEAVSERADRLKTLVSSTIYTPNEARAEEGKDPIEGGDSLLVLNTMVPLETLAEAVAAKIAAPAQQMNGGSGGDQAAEGEGQDAEGQQRAALAAWERKAVARVKRGKSAACSFLHPALTDETAAAITARLAVAQDAAAARAAFRI